VTSTSWHLVGGLNVGLDLGDKQPLADQQSITIVEVLGFGGPQGGDDDDRQANGGNSTDLGTLWFAGGCRVGRLTAGTKSRAGRADVVDQTSSGDGGET
jgi:hypothetical protein